MKINFNEFKTEQELAHFASVNGYDANGVKKLIEEWKAKDDPIPEVVEDEQPINTPDFGVSLD